MDVRSTDLNVTEKPQGFIEGMSLAMLPKMRKRRVGVLRFIVALTFFIDAMTVIGSAQFVHWISRSSTGTILPDLLLAGVVTSTMYLRGHYDLAQRSDATEYGQVLGAVNLAIPLGLVVLRLLNSQVFSIDGVLFLWPTMLGLICVERFVLRRVRFSLMRKPELRQRTLVVGVTDESRSIVRQWKALSSSTVEPVGFLEDPSVEPTGFVEGLRVLGSSTSIDSVVVQQGIDSVLIARPELIHSQLVHSDTIMRTLSQVEVYSTTGIADLFTSTACVREEAFIPLIVLSKRRMSGVHLAAKTLLDYVGTLVLLTLAGWLMLILWILVKLDSAGPPIYKHKRIGLHDKVFYVFKFRSMHIDGNSRLSPEQEIELRETMKLKDDPRITRIGKFLRKTSLDELPQLFNVLRGEMSWVGPRPIVEHEAERFGMYRHLRSTVKPGLTGLWQVSGRSDVSYEERVNLDTYYVRNHTIWLDIEILFKTIPALLRGRGAY